MLKNIASKILIWALLISAGVSVGIFAKEAIRWYNTPPIITKLNTANHFKNTNKKIVIYTAKWCPYCKKLKKYLATKGLSYENRDIEHGSNRDKKLFKSLPGKGIPKILIGNEMIIGFHKEILDKEIKKLQRNG